MIQKKSTLSKKQDEPEQLIQTDFNFDGRKIFSENVFGDQEPSVDHVKSLISNLAKEGHDRFHLHEIRDLIQKLPFYKSLKLQDNEPPNHSDLNYLARLVKYQHLFPG